jgi:hypothetical protein
MKPGVIVGIVLAVVFAVAAIYAVSVLGVAAAPYL